MLGGGDKHMAAGIGEAIEESHAIGGAPENQILAVILWIIAVLA